MFNALIRKRPLGRLRTPWTLIRPRTVATTVPAAPTTTAAAGTPPLKSSLPFLFWWFVAPLVFVLLVEAVDLPGRVQTWIDSAGHSLGLW